MCLGDGDVRKVNHFKILLSRVLVFNFAYVGFSVYSCTVFLCRHVEPCLLSLYSSSLLACGAMPDSAVWVQTILVVFTGLQVVNLLCDFVPCLK